jgi:hypothetical protein
MSRAPVSMSHLPAMNVTGTSIFDSDTRRCSETPRASLAYHEGCVVQNSCISVRSSAGSAVGLISRVMRSMFAVALVHGIRRVSGASARPDTHAVRATPTMSCFETTGGRRRGASIVANVLPGTPATARIPLTRSG